MENQAVTVDITSTLFQNPGWKNILSEIRVAADREQFRLGIQLHNTSYQYDIDCAVATGLPLTAHIPLLSNWQINFAAEDLGPCRQSLHDSIRLMRDHDITQGVMHAFVMTDLPIPSFGRGRSYDEGMKPIYRPEISIPGSRVCGNFFALPEYLHRRDRVKRRLAWMRREFPDVEIVLENDFPTYGAANLFADGAAALDHDLCLDSSHLWASAHIFDRDYNREVEAFTATGRIKMVHLHASICPPDTPKGAWTDGHQPLNSPTAMDLQHFVTCCRRNGVRHFVLEIRGVTATDITILGQWWRAAAAA